jgi:hypothetical protein
MNFDIIKFLEAASYLAAVGVFVVAIVALKQISTTRKIARTSSKREAMTLASKQVEVYMDKIIKKSDALFVEVTRRKLKVFSESTFKLTEDSILVDLKPNKIKAVDEMFLVIDELLDQLNALEAFATYFTSQLADESLAYKSVGNSYCFSVKMYMPAIVTLGSGEHFQNTVELYRLWQNRVDEEALLSSKKEIEKKLGTINGKTIVPLGASPKD